MDSLKFIETMSVADFKTKMEVERIDPKIRKQSQWQSQLQ